MTTLDLQLLTFVEARLNEDEQAARAAQHPDGPQTLYWRKGGQRHLTFDNGRGEDYVSVFCGDWDRILVARDGLSGDVAAHIARQDPARALAEVRAKRLIIAEYREADEAAKEPGEISGRIARFAFWIALTALAEIWADHPDFDPLWRT